MENQNKLLVRILMVLLSIFFQSAFIGAEASVIFLLNVSLWQKWGAGRVCPHLRGVMHRNTFCAVPQALGTCQDSAPLCLGWKRFVQGNPGVFGLGHGAVGVPGVVGSLSV